MGAHSSRMAAKGEAEDDMPVLMMTDESDATFPTDMTAEEALAKMSSEAAALAKSADEEKDEEKEKEGEEAKEKTTIPAFPVMTGLSISTPWNQIVQDFIRFIQREEPWSVEADVKGEEWADFLIKNAELAAAIEEKAKELNKKLRHGLFWNKHPVKVTYFKNWAGTRQGLVLYARPKDVEAVKHLVKACAELNIKVGCGGAYHSWGPLFPDASTVKQFTLLISNRDLEIDKFRLFGNDRVIFDKDAMEVTITPGVTTGELLDVFLKENVCFSSDVIAQNFTYGGVLSTGSHGTGREEGVVSDRITSIKIVGPDGELHTFPHDIERGKFKLPEGISCKDAMNALRVNLGVFGVVVEYTLKVDKGLPGCQVESSYPQLGELFYGDNPRIKTIMKEHWSVQMLWFPFNSLNIVGGLIQGLPLVNIWQPRTDEVWLHIVDKTDLYAETNRWEQMETKITDTISAGFAGELGSPLISRYPFLVPAYLAFGHKLIKATNPPGKSLEQLPYAIHFRYGLKYAAAYDMEFAFPVNMDDPDHGFDKLIQALNVVVEEIYKAAQLGWFFFLPRFKSFPLTAAVDLRLIKKSSCLLCPAVKLEDDSSTHTAYIEILSFVGTENYKKFFRTVGEKWIEIGGVPHWAKQWSFLKRNGLYDHLKKYYGKNLTKFNELRKLFGDGASGKAKDMFLNETMRDVLQ